MNKASPVPPGMPPLGSRRNITSFFEFWPSQLVYLPVVLQWLLLSARHRSWSLPLLANPGIPLSGMVGESKAGILALSGPRARTVIAPWVVLTKREGCIEGQTEQALQCIAEAGFTLPVVAKPDQGCRGAGVWKVTTPERLADYIRAFPVGQRLILQRLSPYAPEAGIFYIRHPDQPAGEVFSLTLKYPPVVVGDGDLTLRQLILNDARASRLTEVYFPRLRDRLDEVIPTGEMVTLAFAGNHCRGSLFRNGNAHITPALVQALDRVLADVPGFHYGRLDIRFRDIEALGRGEDFEIIEINGGASEATHIWDPDTRLREVYEALFRQYRTLFAIGAQLRRQGHRPPGLWPLLLAWWQERRLVAQYPATD